MADGVRNEGWVEVTCRRGSGNEAKRLERVVVRDRQGNAIDLPVTAVYTEKLPHKPAVMTVKLHRFEEVAVDSE